MSPEPDLRTLRRRRALTCGTVTLLVVVAAMGCGRTSSVLSLSDSDYPQENRSPSHVVRVHGTISRTIEVRLTAYYGAHGGKECQWTAPFPRGTKHPLSVLVPVAVARNGEDFSATVAVDHFLPGRCTWALESLGAEVGKDDVWTVRNSVLNKTRPEKPPYKEDGGLNSQDTPVTWGCRFSTWGKTRPGWGSASCFQPINPPDSARGKQSHLVTDSTRSVEMRFIDVGEP